MKFRINKLLFLLFLFVFLFSFFSLVKAEEKDKEDIFSEHKIEELSIKLKSLQVAKQVEEFLDNHPELSLKQLQNNLNFQEIAVQKVGENGYTALIDSETGYIYFHPQKKLINIDSHSLAKALPDFWSIFSRSLGSECKESSGYYKWIEADGKETEKYLYIACVNKETSDHKHFLVSTTAYIDKDVAQKYLEEYKIKKNFSYSKDAIKQRSFDIAKQIELYLKANPKKTLEDLKKDDNFQELAIQKVGESGYTYIVTHETGFLDFHPDPKIRETSYNDFKNRFPEIWRIMDKSVNSNPCQDSDGFYKWADINGKVRDKYTYHHCVHAKTADGYSFFLGASTYLDEYEDPEQILQNNIIKKAEKTESNEFLKHKPEKEINLINLTYLFIALTLLAFLILYILYHFNIVKFEGRIIMFLLGSASLIIIILFIFNTYQVAQHIRKNAVDSYQKQQIFLAQQVINNIETKLGLIINDAKILAVSKESLDSDSFNFFLGRIKRYAESMVIVNNRGDILERLFSQNNYNDNFNDSVLIKIIKEHTIKISPVLEDKSGEKAFFIILPINDKEDDRVFLIKVSLNILFQRYMENIVSEKKTILALATEDKIYGFDGYIKNTPKEFLNYIQKGNIYSFQSSKSDLFNSQYKQEQSLKTYYPFKKWGNNWGIIILTPLSSIYSSLAKDINRIWYFTIIIIIFILIIAFVFNFFITASLKKKIINKTKEVEQNNKIISEQLKKREEDNLEKENLIKRQEEIQKKLQDKLEELEKFRKITINRELKMIELKKELKKYKKLK